MIFSDGGVIVSQERENSDSSDWFGVVFSGLIFSCVGSSFSDLFSAFVSVVISSVSLFIVPVVSFV